IVGYYDQALDEVSCADSMIGFVQNRVRVDNQRAHQVLANAGFAFRDHGRSVLDLSGGERARLLFLVLGLAKPNFLIMDEPTNHIDIEGKEQLERELIASSATLLITSHDRHFIQTVTERYLWIHNGRLEEIFDLADFFDSPGVEMASDQATAGQPVERREVLSGPDAVLARIGELETKLEGDLQRKPKFQKPKLREAWRAELDELYRQLDDELSVTP
ncbi:MAG: ATP-binding cassette domain-containing protein, partial [Gammaproteobacteria bacterium]